MDKKIFAPNKNIIKWFPMSDLKKKNYTMLKHKRNFYHFKILFKYFVFCFLKKKSYSTTNYSVTKKKLYDKK